MKIEINIEVEVKMNIKKMRKQHPNLFDGTLGIPNAHLVAA